MRFSILCFALGLLATSAAAQNFCGRGFEDAKKCATPCPRGVDSECPSGESCFASVPCSSPGNPGTSGNYCGRGFEDAKKCATGCPRGVDSECPSGERCFASVSCSSGPATVPPTPPTPPGALPVSQQQFNSFFPNRDPLYTFAGLVSAAAAYPGFMKTGSLETQRREAAAFLANVAHESGNLRFTRELNRANWNSYCDRNTALANGFTADCRKNGRKFQYYGRGPIQLSWNFNYLSAGRDFNIDLINNPDRVATDASVSWKTAVWFWMREKGAGTMTAHNAMVNGAGFGETIRSINGALECNGKRPDIVTTRVNYYTRFVGALGASTGPNLRC